GEAFQLRDDILGAFGDSAVTGKPVGEDLREGKPTPLLAIAAERAGSDATRLLARIGAPDLGDEEVEAIQGVMIDTGARDATEARVAALVKQAVAALAAIDLTPDAAAALAELAAYVGQRDR